VFAIHDGCHVLLVDWCRRAVVMQLVEPRDNLNALQTPRSALCFVEVSTLTTIGRSTASFKSLALASNEGMASAADECDCGGGKRNCSNFEELLRWQIVCISDVLLTTRSRWAHRSLFNPWLQAGDTIRRIVNQLYPQRR